MKAYLLQIVTSASVAIMLTACDPHEVPAGESVADACSDPEYQRPQNLYEAQLDFMLRAYHPANYLDDTQRAQLLNSIAGIQDRDAQKLAEKWRALEPYEQDCLNRIYEDNHPLDGRLLALQDNDQDGIKDFRINYYGEFFENDTDADNDGIDNVLDITPFNADADSFDDQDQDGSADHLDWSNTELYDKSTETQVMQQRLHQDFGVLLVEGNHPFSPAMVRVIQDVLYRALDNKRSTFRAEAAIKYIFSTARPYIPAYESEYYGSVHTGTRRMYLFAAAFDTLDENQTRIATFLTLVHEFIHGLQFSMDYPENLQNHLQWNTDANIPNFVHALNSLGWSIDLTDMAESADRVYRGFMFNEASHVPFVQHYGEGDHRVSIGELENQYYSDAPPDERYGIINSYSLGNMWEWHAEYVTASVLQRMYKATHKLLGDAGYSAMLACVQDKLLALYGEDYTYRLDKARPDIMSSLESLFPINDDDLTYLAKKYIVKPFQGCSS